MGKFYSIQNKSDKEVDILVYGIIGDYWEQNPVTASQFVKDFKALEQKYDRINIRINSPGGLVFEGLPMYNAIANSEKDIHTYNDGLAASMGAVLLMSAKKGKVHSAKNALTMIHAPSSLVIGNAKDMREEAELLDKISEVLAISISDKTGLTTDDVKTKWMDYKDHWFTAEEAEKEGLLITDDYQAETKAGVKNMTLPEIMNMYRESEGSPENFFSKFTQRMAAIFAPTPITIEQTKNVTIMKNLVNLLAVLAISEIALTDGATSLTEDQLKSIEDKLATISDLESKLAASEKAKTDALAELETAKTELTAAKNETVKVQKAFDDFKAEDASEESKAQKKKDEFAKGHDDFASADYNKMADNL